MSNFFLSPFKGLVTKIHYTERHDSILTILERQSTIKLIINERTIINENPLRPDIQIYEFNKRKAILADLLNMQDLSQMTENIMDSQSSVLDMLSERNVLYQENGEIHNINNCHSCKFIATDLQSLARHFKQNHLSSNEKKKKSSITIINRSVTEEEGSMIMEDSLSQSVNAETDKTHMFMDPIVMRKNRNFECQICHKIFSSSQAIKCHFKMVHPHEEYDGKEGNNENMEIPCDVCNGIFNGMANLKIHYKLKHGKKLIFDTYKCEECQFSSNSKRTMERHLDSQHSDIFHCEHCENRYSNIKSLNNHLRTHGNHFNSFPLQENLKLNENISNNNDINERSNVQHKPSIIQHKITDFKSSNAI